MLRMYVFFFWVFLVVGVFLRFFIFVWVMTGWLRPEPSFRRRQNWGPDRALDRGLDRGQRRGGWKEVEEEEEDEEEDERARRRLNASFLYGVWVNCFVLCLFGVGHSWVSEFYHRALHSKANIQVPMKDRGGSRMWRMPTGGPSPHRGGAPSTRSSDRCHMSKKN